MQVRKIAMAAAARLMVATAGADEVDDLIKRGQQAYADKNYPQAVDIFGGFHR